MSAFNAGDPGSNKSTCSENMDLVEAAFRKIITLLACMPCKWLRRQEEAKKAVQDVFVNIWKKSLNRGQPESLSLYSYPQPGACYTPEKAPAYRFYRYFLPKRPLRGAQY